MRAFASSDGSSAEVAAQAERKFGVALFADLSGYTALCQRLDPEDVELTIGPVMRALRGAVSNSGGVIMTVAGDGFFAMYGVPQAVADAPVRAVQAALEMRSLVATWNADPSGPEVPDVHIGIAAGEVLVTPNDDPGGLSLIGSAINLASRLCDAAGPGEVLVDAETKVSLGPTTEWSGSRTLDLRGHAEPVIAWEPARIDATRSFVYREPDFVGREDVHARLDAIAAAVAEQHSSAVVDVAGDAGIGKTRAVRQWLGSRRHEHTTFVCSADAGAASAIDLLRMVAASLGVPAAELEQLVVPGASASDRRDPARAVQAALRRHLRQLAGGSGPHVLVVDDFDEADVSLAAAFEHLGAAALQAPLLIVLIHRSPEATPGSTDVVEVEALDDRAIALIAEQLLEAIPAPTLSRALVGRVAGNPLMAIHSVAYLIESGGLVEVDGSRAAESPGVLERLPGTLRLFVSARLDALSPQAKSLVRALSTFGEPASDGFVSDVLGAHVLSGLDPLVGSGLLRKDGDGRYDFAHKLNREVTYASLTRSTRADLHRRQLTVLADDAPPALRSFHALGWHRNVAEGSGQAQEAAPAALKETLQYAELLNQSSAGAALHVLRRNRSLTELPTGSGSELAVRMLLLESSCHFETGDFTEALAAANRSISMSADAELRSELQKSLLAQGAALSRLQRYEAARQSLDQAAELADQLGDRSAKAQALRLIGHSWRHTAFRRYAALTENAYDLYLEANDASGAAECARLLAYLYAAASVTLHERWLAVAGQHTAADDVRGQAWLAIASAIAAGARLDYPTAVRDAGTATRLGSEVGAIDLEIDGRTLLVVSQFASGNVPEALVQAKAMLRLDALVSNPRMRAAAAVQSAGTFLRAGHPERCAEELRIAREVFRSLGVVEAEALAAAEGAIATIRGDWPRALESFVEDERAADEAGYDLFALLARVDQSRLLIELGRPPATLPNLFDEANQARVPLVASLVHALAERVAVAADPIRSPTPARAQATVEEQSIRADTNALRREALGADAQLEWSLSRASWQRLGYSVLLARAQARCGDRATAEHTLDVLDSPDDARRWALGE